MPGWKSSLAKCKTFESLPENAQKYVETIENYVNVPGMQKKENFIFFYKSILLSCFSQVDWSRSFKRCNSDSIEVQIFLKILIKNSSLCASLSMLYMCEIL